MLYYFRCQTRSVIHKHARRSHLGIRDYYDVSGIALRKVSRDFDILRAIIRRIYLTVGTKFRF